MKQDKYFTDVIFRIDTTKDFKDTVFALMPHECCNFQGSVTYYEHVGQHSAADYNHCIRKSRPAKMHEYAELKRELKSIGYRVNVVNRQNHSKYLKSYKEVRKIS